MRNLYISINEQLMRLCDGDELVKQYVVSTAENGVGCEEGSYCTPMGRFEIREKIGGGEDVGTIFKGRVPVGVWDGTPSDEDMILSRILRLDGLDPDNLNTMSRYIYVHGTNQEGYLGKPKSCGCIRMSNKDMLELYDLVEEGVPLTIGL